MQTTMDLSSSFFVASQNVYAPELQTVAALIEAEPSQIYPFLLKFTFEAPEEIYKGGLELYVPQRTFLYDVDPSERFSPLTRDFFTVVSSTLPVKSTGSGSVITMYPVNMQKGELLTIYLPLKPFKLADNVPWPPPQPVATSENSSKEYRLTIYNLQRKAIAEITRISAPVFVPNAIAAVARPEQRKLSGDKTGSLVVFKILFGDEIPPGRLEVQFTPLQKRGEMDTAPDETVNTRCTG